MTEANARLYQAIRTILRGIDMCETDREYDALGNPVGWWETSGQAQFGANRLAEIEQLLENAP